ncbi:Sterile alpha motif domain-containing protein 15 [Folsomia candida]|uniref:Sterile alpha motif domain-containing protein 15 n=1 Tax=Folsomia candida TaxID=158441 RepID=A0A226EQQ7_FOLCA|nr:Sterile alpha motif domain-containing protein 15 [Folsomia candida]
MFKKLLGAKKLDKAEAATPLIIPKEDQPLVAQSEQDGDDGVGGGGGDMGGEMVKANSKAASSLVRQSEKHRFDLYVPKDRAAWLEYLVTLVKKRTKIEYLNDRELRKVIMRARPNLAGKKPVVKFDPDSPICFHWTVEQTADWIVIAGFPFLKEAFLMNQISGRRLVLIDCSALNQMGMTDLFEMKKVTARIRELLKIPAPNILRAIMRIPPFEKFIKRKVHLGKETDALTFEKFCQQEGFNYSMLKGNKNAVIPCTCEVRILPLGQVDDDEEEVEESEGEDISLLNAPTVEFVVRNLEARDKTVSYIIELMIENVFMPNSERTYGKVAESFKAGLEKSFDEMGNMSPQERLEFATTVARSLMDELQHTADILCDLELLQNYIQEEISPERLEWLQSCAAEFMENVLPIASLMALGELDLETIFEQEPEFSNFVDGVIVEAEKRIKVMELPGLSVTDISSGTGMVKVVLEQVVDNVVEVGDDDILRQTQGKLS